ncbi:MAG: AbrB/MazE/SpoVT family DNA-binding domain-containing protein [Candidatus Bathyarchaeia archaeon]
MPRTYRVKRKLQEQSGAYIIALPKIWVEALGLKQGDLMEVTFNGEVKIKPVAGEKHG